MEDCPVLPRKPLTNRVRLGRLKGMEKLEAEETWKLIDEDGELRCEFPKDLGNQVLEYIITTYEDAGLTGLLEILGKSVN